MAQAAGRETMARRSARGARNGGSRTLDKIELRKLQGFLRRSLGNEEVRVTADPKNPDDAAVHLGERKIASISVDDEDGDRSFAFAMKLPVGRETLQSYLRKLFENDRLTIAPRGRKTDSVELNCGEDFLGVISADDPKQQSYTLQVAILDFDLDDF
jgi:hypothetical protein